MPETKGRTLEDIEQSWHGTAAPEGDVPFAQAKAPAQRGLATERSS